eukprot:gene23046-27891_t
MIELEAWQGEAFVGVTQDDMIVVLFCSQWRREAKRDLDWLLAADKDAAEAFTHCGASNWRPFPTVVAQPGAPVCSLNSVNGKLGSPPAKGPPAKGQEATSALYGVSMDSRSQGENASYCLISIP